MSPGRMPLAVALVALGAPAAPAQEAGAATEPQGRQTSTLHGAWLLEILDLRPHDAAAAYRRVAADPDALGLDRQIATARLLELRLLDVVSAEPAPDPARLPTVLQRHVEEASGEAQRAAVQRELAAGHADRPATAEFLATADLPPLRPLVLVTALAAAEEVDPDLAERLRRLRFRYLPWSSDPARVLERIRANEIVGAELDGDDDEASTLRRSGFPNWEPRPWPADAAIAFRQVRTNLEEWLLERQLTPAEIHLLQRLRAALDDAAEDDPAAALRLLDRMPLYAERLRQGLDDRRGR